MKSVSDLADEIIEREGGFVNDPSDPGGATKFGVTIGTMKTLGIDLNKDGRVTESDVKLLTKERAKQIFLERYFDGPGIDMLPVELQPTVFDMYVNAGKNAVRILQRLLRVNVDGVLGHETAAAAQRWVNANKDAADTYSIARRDYYYTLADRRPSSRKYARRNDGGKGGWITRAEEFMSPEVRLTEAQHRARVTKWG